MTEGLSGVLSGLLGGKGGDLIKSALQCTATCATNRAARASTWRAGLRTGRTPANAPLSPRVTRH